MHYLFGDYTLNTQRYELRRAGTLVKLRPKVFDVLAYLMAHRDRIVSKRELLEQLWPQQFPAEATLHSCIRAAREAEPLAVALGDPRRLGQVSVFRSHDFRSMGIYDQSSALGQHALARATAAGDVLLRALANQDLGSTYLTQGDCRRASDCLGQTVASCDGAWRHKRFGTVALPAVFSRYYLARRPLLAHYHLGLGTLYTQVDRPAQGRSTANLDFRPLALDVRWPSHELTGFTRAAMGIIAKAHSTAAKSSFMEQFKAVQ